jgi:hypothetical protein
LRHRVGGRGAFLAATALLLSACSIDKVLQVPDPDVSRPTDLTGKAALPTFRAAAIGDFQVAFAGTGGLTGLEGLVNITGLFTDEFTFTETFPTRVQIDRRAIGLMEAGRRAGLLRFPDADSAYHTLYGLVVSDLHVRMLLGEPGLKDNARQAARAVDAFLQLHGVTPDTDHA